MDINEYIASGIIESFVLGSVSDQERREVECLSSIYPEIREEIIRYQKAIETVASESAIPTSEETKKRVLSAVYEEIDKDSKPNNDEAPIIEANFSQKTSSTFRWKYLAAACFVLFLIATTVFLRSNRENSRMANELQEIENRYALENKHLQEELYQLSDENYDLNWRMAILSNPETKYIPLNGTDLSSSSKVSVYWDASAEKLLLKVNELPEAPENLQYQFWAIVDGTPVDMGMLPVDFKSNEFYYLNNVSEASAFAITLEELGGKPTPNLEQLYVIGNV